MTHIPRAQLRERGVSDGEVRSAIRAGTIAAVRRGYYVDTSEAHDRYLLEIRAALMASSADMVLSHTSAAAVHGIAVWPDDDRVHLTVNRSTGGRRSRLRIVHASRLHPDDVEVVDGLRVTSPARTVVDLACSRSFESAVCSGDSALRRIDKTELADTLDRSGGRRGIDRARRAVAFMDGRSESVGESRSRVYLQRHGFPTPRLQVELRDTNGVFVARPDFLLDGVIGEFDGMVKYREFGDSSDAVIAEKRREDRLRALGWQVARWGWDELTTGAPADRIRRALEVASTLPPPRTVDCTPPSTSHKS
ncbi:MAG: hypothetical protein WBF79_11095 [Rhodococcus sp. (in: high G+C Gram-positive bacteria)]